MRKAKKKRGGRGVGKRGKQDQLISRAICGVGKQKRTKIEKNRIEIGIDRDSIQAIVSDMPRLCALSAFCHASAHHALAKNRKAQANVIPKRVGN